MTKRLFFPSIVIALAVAIALHIAGVPMDPHAVALGAVAIGAGILDVQTIAAAPGFPLKLAQHRFSSSSSGELLHYIDDTLTATVPPEGWDDYVKYFPPAIDVVRQLRAAHTANQASAAADTQARITAALAAVPGADPKTIALVKTAVTAALGGAPAAAAAAPDPLKDPAVQAAIATLKAKGIDVSGA